MDSEDLSRGWLVGKIMGRGSPEPDEEDHVATDGSNNGKLGRAQINWGARGISVSADEEPLQTPQPRRNTHSRRDLDSAIRRDDGAGIFEDNIEAEDSDDGTTPHNDHRDISIHGVGSGEEWRNEGNR